MRERIENFRRRLTLRGTLVAVMLIVTAAMLIPSGAVQLYYNSRVQREAISSRQLLVAEQAATAVKGYIQDNIKILETAVSLNDITQMTPDELENLLGITVGSQAAFRHLALYGVDGQLLARSSRLSQPKADAFVAMLEEEPFAPVKQAEQYISPVIIDEETSEPLIIISVPAISLLGDFRGTIVAELNLKFMWDLVDQLKVGETGFAYVVDRKGDLLAYSDTARVLRGENVSHLVEVAQFVAGENEAEEEEADIEPGLTGEESVQTYVPLGTPDWAVVVELPSDEAFRPVNQGVTTIMLVHITSWIVIGLISLLFANRLAAPLNKLTETAAQIADGNLDLQAEVDSPVEVTRLGDAFNRMTGQLKDLISSLELRVIARTRALEISGEVSRRLSTILDRDELVKTVVEQVRDAFDYYHAHIYLFDETGENLVMAGGTGQAGRTMLANNHQIAAGKGLVGRAGQTRQAVFVADTSQEAGWLPNPLLPDTKAEIAVPIMSDEQVFGVLDVQHNLAGELTQADVDLLQSIGNQVAVALRNANLYHEQELQAQQAAMINEINQKILKTTDMQTAMQVAVRELGRASQAGQVRISLVKDAVPQGNENGQQ